MISSRCSRETALGCTEAGASFRLHCLFAALLLFASLTAHCATQSWNPGGAGGGNGTWDTGVTQDWDSGVVWTDSNDALFGGNGGIVTVVSPIANSLAFSATGPYVLTGGTLTLSGSNVTVESDATIASTLAGNGLTLNGGGTLTVTGSGNFGSGIVDVEGGTLAVQNSFSDGTGYIGNEATSSGSVVASGSGASWTNSGNLFIGGSGAGALLITNGATVTSSNGYIAAYAGSTGSVTVSGSSSSWTVATTTIVGGHQNPLSEGSGGTGLLLITNGASYTPAGLTVFPGSTLALGNNATLNAGISGVEINGGTLAIGVNATWNAPIGGQLFLVSGTMTLVDGVLNTFTVPEGSSLLSNSSFDLEVGNGSDQINVQQADASGDLILNLYGLSGLVASGTDVLLENINQGTPVLGNVYNTGNFSYSLLNVSTGPNASNEEVIVTATTPLTTAYWKGGQSNVWSVAVGGTATNWTTDAAGTIDPGLTPSATTNVIFSATGAANQSETVLGTDMTIGGLTISDTNPVVISGSDSQPLLPDNDTLTIVGPAGTTVNAGAGPVTIGANLYLGGNAQDIIVNNAAGLLVTGTLGGSDGLVKTGTGTLTLAGPANFGAATVAAQNGTLEVQNSLVDGLGVVGFGASNALVKVSGTGATWTTNGDLYVGEIAALKGSIDLVTVPGSGGASTLTVGAALLPSYSGSGTLKISLGAAVSDSNGWIANSAGSSGLVGVSGTGTTWTNAGILYVGESGTGTLRVLNGALVSSSGGGIIGDQPGSTGIATVNGNGSTWTNDGALYVGYSGTGTLLILNAGAVSDVNGSIGYGSGATGSVMVTGSGSSLTSTVNLIVGEYGAGAVAITNGGAVSDQSAYLGDRAGSAGQLTVSGSDSTWTNTGEIFLGESGTGALLITGGAGVYAGSGSLIGDLAGSTGLATVSGSDSIWINDGDLTIGNAGDGNMLISNGGAVYNDNGWIAYSASSTGIVTVSGSGSNWTNEESLYVGESGTGTLLISNGGIASANDEAIIGDQAGSNGRVSVSGSGSAFGAGSLYVGESGTGSLVITGGGGVLGGVGSIGDGPGSTGTVTVSGSGSTLNMITYLVDGFFGAGALAITNGGAVLDSYAGIGVSAGSTGIAIVSGSGSTWTNDGAYYNGDLDDGYYGAGTLLISSAAAVSDSNGWIGYGAGSSGTARVGGVGSSWTNSVDLYVGASGTGTLSIFDGATVTSASNGYIGVNPGSIGSATISGSGSSWTTPGDLAVAYSGTGTLAINTGGALSDGNGFVAFSAGSSGSATVSGSGSDWTSAGGLIVADSGSGSVVIAGGGALSDGNGSIGYGGGSNGTVTLIGQGSHWTSGNNLIVGYSGAGRFSIATGASASADGNSYIAYAAASTGAAAVSGSGSSWSTAGSLAIGYSGTGTLVVTGGGALSDGNAYIGYNPGSHGAVAVTGSGSTWSTAGNLAVGYSGTGTLAITGGASVSDAGALIGLNPLSNGSVTVSGTGSSWTSSAGLSIGQLAPGTVTILNGGLAAVTGTTTIGSLGTLRFDGNSTFNTGSLAVNGGTIVTLGASIFTPSATVQPGGLNILSAGFNSTFSGNFSGAGGLAKSGLGTIALTGSSSYSGATTVTAGTLAITTGTASAASLGNTAISVRSGARFSATLAAGSVSSTVTAGATGPGGAGATLTLAPGSAFSMVDGSIGVFKLDQENAFSGPAFTIGGALGLAPTLSFEIGNAAAGTDMIDVTRTVSVLATGGKITIDALAGDTSLTAGNYDLISSAGGFSGTGGNGFTLGDSSVVVDGTTYDLSLAESTADDEVLTVSAATPVRYTDAERTPVENAAAPRESTPLAGTAAVPEPGATMTLLSVFAVAGAWRLRRRR